MSEIYVGDGYITERPAVRRQAHDAVVHHRFLTELRKAQQAGRWAGRVECAVFVLLLLAAWWIGSNL